MLYTKYDKYRFNSNSTFQISDLENPEAIDEYEKELVRELDMDKDLKIAVDDTKKNGKVYKDRMKEIKELLATETDKAKIKALKLESKNCRAGYERLLSKHLDVIQRKYDLKKDFE